MVALTDLRKLGKTDIMLPPLGFGCAPIGEPSSPFPHPTPSTPGPASPRGRAGEIYDRISDEQAAETFETALEMGVRYFDVAPSYGVGLAEQRIGRALRTAADQPTSFHVPRSEVFLSTKVSRQLVPDRTVTPNTMDHADGHGWAGGLTGFNSVIDLTYEGFMTQHTESLHRMGQPYVDGLLMHSQPLPGTEGWEQLTSGGGFRAMEELRDTGAVRAIGTGGGRHDSIEAMLEHCSIDYVCLPTSYTLLGQEVHDDGTMQLAMDNEIGVVIFAPFNGGILVGGSAAAENRSKSAPFSLLRL